MGTKRRRLQERLDDREETIERQRESIEHLRADLAKLRSRPTIAKLPEGDQDVYTVVVADIQMERAMVPMGTDSGYMKYLPGAITISLVCTGPQPDGNMEGMMGGKFALVPVSS